MLGIFDAHFYIISKSPKWNPKIPYVPSLVKQTFAPHFSMIYHNNLHVNTIWRECKCFHGFFVSFFNIFPPISFTYSHSQIRFVLNIVIRQIWVNSLYSLQSLWLLGNTEIPVSILSSVQRDIKKEREAEMKRKWKKCDVCIMLPYCWRPINSLPNICLFYSYIFNERTMCKWFFGMWRERQTQYARFDTKDNNYFCQDIYSDWKPKTIEVSEVTAYFKRLLNKQKTFE